MALTRHYDPLSGQDGPVSGALQVIHVRLTDVGNGETAFQRVTMPAGMSFEITDIVVSASAVTSDPALTIGTTAAGTQIVASVNVTTNLGALTIKDGTVAAAGLVDVRIVADAGDAASDVDVTIVGHVAAPPTSVPDRGPNSPG